MEKILTAFFIMFSPTIWAVQRGGICRSEICEATGFSVFLVLCIFFLGTLLYSIKEKGILEGIIKHQGIAFLLIYSSVIGGLILMGYFIKEFSPNKDSQFIMWGAVLVIIFVFGKYKKLL